MEQDKITLLNLHYHYYQKKALNACFTNRYSSVDDQNSQIPFYW